MFTHRKKIDVKVQIKLGHFQSGICTDLCLHCLCGVRSQTWCCFNVEYRNNCYILYDLHMSFTDYIFAKFPAGKLDNTGSIIINIITSDV